MANVTLVFAVLLAGLGLGGYLGTGSLHPTALIPAGFGIALGIFGFLASSPDEGRRKLFMHINVMIGLVGFVGTVVEIFRSLTSSNDLDLIALAAKLGLAWLLLIYVILCVRSFIVVRRAEALAALRSEVVARPSAVIAPPKAVDVLRSDAFAPPKDAFASHPAVDVLRSDAFAPPKDAFASHPEVDVLRSDVVAKPKEAVAPHPEVDVLRSDAIPPRSEKE